MRSWRAAFWCALQGREVEVEFVTRGIPVLSQPCGMRSCSAFDPATAILCHRRCLDATYRRQWPPALPVYTHEIVRAGRERR